MSLMQEINSTFTDYAPLLNGVQLICTLLAFIASLIFFAHKKIKQQFFPSKPQARNLTPDERKIFQAVYDNICNALELVFRNGTVTQEALFLFYKARDQAGLQLPDDIQEYSENLLDLAIKIFVINMIHLSSEDGKGLSIGKERSDKAKEHASYVFSLGREKPHEKFAKYMKVDVA